jgi:hypothetical protein
VLADRDRLVVCVCRSGARSRRVTDGLLGAGIEAVNLTGGMPAWAAAGRPVVDEGGGRGHETAAKAFLCQATISERIHTFPEPDGRSTQSISPRPHLQAAGVGNPPDSATAKPASARIGVVKLDAPRVSRTVKRI